MTRTVDGREGSNVVPIQNAFQLVGITRLASKGVRQDQNGRPGGYFAIQSRRRRETFGANPLTERLDRVNWCDASKLNIVSRRRENYTWLERQSLIGRRPRPFETRSNFWDALAVLNRFSLYPNSLGA